MRARAARAGIGLMAAALCASLLAGCDQRKIDPKTGLSAEQKAQLDKDYDPSKSAERLAEMQKRYGVKAASAVPAMVDPRQQRLQVENRGFAAAYGPGQKSTDGPLNAVGAIVILASAALAVLAFIFRRKLFPVKAPPDVTKPTAVDDKMKGWLKD